MTGKLMKIRRAGACADCGAELPVGTSAYWVATEKVVRCVQCVGQAPADPQPAAESVILPRLADTPPDRVTPKPQPGSVSDTNVAGGSALHEYDRRSAKERAKKEQKVAADAEWRATVKQERPILGHIVAAFTPKPVITPESQSTKAWKVGAEGEQRVAEVMATATGVEVLHDRRVPGSKANIDHIVVGPKGVFVVDAKKYTGEIEVRDVGGLFKVDLRLYVNNRDRTSTVDGVLGQLEVVRTALADAYPNVPVSGVLCFINADWGWRMKQKIVKGVTVLWPLALPDHVSADGPHAQQVEAVAAHLRSRLKPAS